MIDTCGIGHCMNGSANADLRDGRRNPVGAIQFTTAYSSFQWVLHISFLFSTTDTTFEFIAVIDRTALFIACSANPPNSRRGFGKVNPLVPSFPSSALLTHIMATTDIKWKRLLRENWKMTWSSIQKSSSLTRKCRNNSNTAKCVMGDHVSHQVRFQNPAFLSPESWFMTASQSFICQVYHDLDFASVVTPNLDFASV